VLSGARVLRVPLRRIEREVDSDATSPTRRLPLVGFAALQSIVSARALAHRFTRDHHALAVSDGNDGIDRTPSAVRFRKRFHPLVSFAPPPEFYRPRSAPSLLQGTRRLPWGYAPSSRYRLAATMNRDSGSRPSSVRGVSHALDVFTPPTSWVYFTPQPRTGFTFRGFPSREAGHPLSVCRALSSLSPFRCRRLPDGATSRRLAHRALLLVRIRDRRGGG